MTFSHLCRDAQRIVVTGEAGLKGRLAMEDDNQLDLTLAHDAQKFPNCLSRNAKAWNKGEQLVPHH